MDPALLSPIILAIATLITAMASAIIGVITVIRVNAAASKVESIEKHTNSMKDALVAVTASAEHAKGVVVGRREIRNEMGANALAIQDSTRQHQPESTPVVITNPEPVPVTETSGKKS